MASSKQRWLCGLFQLVEIEVRPTRRDFQRKNLMSRRVSFNPPKDSSAYEAFNTLINAHTAAMAADDLEGFYRRLLGWARKQGG